MQQSAKDMHGIKKLRHTEDMHGIKKNKAYRR
jgi:hypothetical protein